MFLVLGGFAGQASAESPIPLETTVTSETTAAKPTAAAKKPKAVAPKAVAPKAAEPAGPSESSETSETTAEGAPEPSRAEAAPTTVSTSKKPKLATEPKLVEQTEAVESKDGRRIAALTDPVTTPTATASDPPQKAAQVEEVGTASTDLTAASPAMLPVLIKADGSLRTVALAAAVLSGSARQRTSRSSRARPSRTPVSAPSTGTSVCTLGRR